MPGCSAPDGSLWGSPGAGGIEGVPWRSQCFHPAQPRFPFWAGRLPWQGGHDCSQQTFPSCLQKAGRSPTQPWRVAANHAAGILGQGWEHGARDQASVMSTRRETGVREGHTLTLLPINRCKRTVGRGPSAQSGWGLGGRTCGVRAGGSCCLSQALGFWETPHPWPGQASCPEVPPTGLSMLGGVGPEARKWGHSPSVTYTTGRPRWLGGLQPVQGDRGFCPRPSLSPGHLPFLFSAGTDGGRALWGEPPPPPASGQVLDLSWSPVPPACCCRGPALGTGSLAVLGIHFPRDSALGLSPSSTCHVNSSHRWPCGREDGGCSGPPGLPAQSQPGKGQPKEGPRGTPGAWTQVL